MSRFLTSFWRQPQSLGEHEDGGDLIASGAAGGATQSSTGAASWITMNDPPKGHRGEPTMAVNQTTVDEVLQPLGDEGAVNLVAIFGAARGGKSFLMNQLAGKDDIFRISNDKVRRRISRYSDKYTQIKSNQIRQVLGLRRIRDSGVSRRTSASSLPDARFHANAPTTTGGKHVLSLMG